MSQPDNTLATNRRAYHDYEIFDTYEAGIVLKGTEIKSLRDKGGNLQDAYVIITEGKPLLIGCSIAPFRFGNIHNHSERRERVLLLHKKEIKKLKSALDEKGLTLIPLSLYLKNGKAKLKIGLAKGKKSYDKRSSIKEKDSKKSISRALKESQQ